MAMEYTFSFEPLVSSVSEDTYSIYVRMFSEYAERLAASKKSDACTRFLKILSAPEHCRIMTREEYVSIIDFLFTAECKGNKAVLEYMDVLYKNLPVVKKQMAAGGRALKYCSRISGIREQANAKDGAFFAQEPKEITDILADYTKYVMLVSQARRKQEKDGQMILSLDRHVDYRTYIDVFYWIFESKVPCEIDDEGKINGQVFTPGKEYEAVQNEAGAAAPDSGSDKDDRKQAGNGIDAKRFFGDIAGNVEKRQENGRWCEEPRWFRALLLEMIFFRIREEDAQM